MVNFQCFQRGKFRIYCWWLFSLLCLREVACSTVLLYICILLLSAICFRVRLLYYRVSLILAVMLHVVRPSFTIALKKTKHYQVRKKTKNGIPRQSRNDAAILPYSGKLSRENTFANWWKIGEKTFTHCLLLPCQKTPHPKILRRKLSQIVTKSRNSRKFSPSKVSHYTVS